MEGLKGENAVMREGIVALEDLIDGFREWPLLDKSLEDVEIDDEVVVNGICKLGDAFEAGSVDDRP